MDEEELDINERRTRPSIMRYYLKCFMRRRRSNGVGGNSSTNSKRSKTTIENLVDVLQHEVGYDKKFACKIVTDSIHDGLIVPVRNEFDRKDKILRFHKHRIMRLPEMEDVRNGELRPNDYYCFECHIPGTLVNCKQCRRSFHQKCYRKNPLRPNYKVPSTRGQKQSAPSFDTDEEESETETAEVATSETHEEADEFNESAEDESTQHNTSDSLIIDQVSLEDTLGSTPEVFVWQAEEDEDIAAAKTSNDDNGDQKEALNNSGSFDNKPNFAELQNESKSALEVVCTGAQSAPRSKRPTTNMSYKSEAPPDDEPDDPELCTCCRLLREKVVRNPPVAADELCHLLQSSFTRYRSWLTVDVNSALDAFKLSKEQRTAVIYFMFKYEDILGCADIAKKIQRNEYSYINEFLVDLLTLQHHIGVFFGEESEELDTTKYLLRDISHDLSEILLCSDCFRYSNENRSSGIWFAKPCRTRHELVYAKVSCYPYWPAKVLRARGNKRDVRFFGSGHSRSIVSSECTRPIDSDLYLLNHSVTPTALQKAIKELQIHQQLREYSRDVFSFHADPMEAERIIQDVLRVFELNDSGSGNRARTRSCNDASAGRVSGASGAGFNAVDSAQLDAQDDLMMSDTMSVRSRRTRSRSGVARAGVGTPTLRRTITRSARRNLRRNAASAAVRQMEQLINYVCAYGNNMPQQLELEEQLEDSPPANNRMNLNDMEMNPNVMNALKRKQWCRHCFQEANFVRCFNAAYCSRECEQAANNGPCRKLRRHDPCN